MSTNLLYMWEDGVCGGRRFSPSNGNGNDFLQVYDAYLLYSVLFLSGVWSGVCRGAGQE